MWTPDPTWQRLADAGDASRLWRRELEGRGAWVGKRLVRPRHDVADDDLTPGDRAALEPSHVLWWRREADVVEQRWAEGLPGLRGPAGGRVEEDADGLTLWWPLVERAPTDDVAVAGALGALAAGPLPTEPWACVDLLGDRWRGVEAAGGWQTISQTAAAEVAETVWAARSTLLAAVARLPVTPTHGDVTPGNLLGASADGGGAAAVVACDWSAAGRGAVGTDLGYYALSIRTRLGPLVEVYAEAAGAAGRPLDRDEVLLGARVQMAFTVLTRVDRTLQRVAGGEGDWPAKVRHPSVAPAMRALQRAYADFSPLLEDL